MVKQKVFISKKLEQDSVFYSEKAQKSIELLDLPFITFEKVPFTIAISDEVLFFASKNAFRFFIDEVKNIPSKIKIACVGLATKKLIENEGYSVAFYSEQAGNITSSTSKFKLWLGDEKVLFVEGKLSNRSFSKEIPSSQKKNLIVYNTLFLIHKITQEFDYYIFTSPSNFLAFIQENKIANTAKLIAWGETTAKAFINQGYLPYKVLKNASEEEALECFF